MPRWHVGGDRRVRPARHHHPHAFRGHLRQQCGDAVRARAELHSPILVQPVHHQHQPLTACPAVPCRLLQQPPIPPLLRHLVQQRGHRLAQQLGQLFDHRSQKRVAVALAGIPRGDEERHHPHARRRMQYEGGQQRRFARPRRPLPPHVRLVVVAGAELGELSQLGLTADEFPGEDLLDLIPIRRARYRRPRQVHVSRDVEVPGVDDAARPALSITGLTNGAFHPRAAHAETLVLHRAGSPGSGEVDAGVRVAGLGLRIARPLHPHPVRHRVGPARHSRVGSPTPACHGPAGPRDANTAAT